MPWYKFVKFFRGGSNSDYLFIKPWGENKVVTRNQLESEMEDWAERRFGGDNYGYTVQNKYIKRVPLKVLKKQLEVANKYSLSLASEYIEKVRQASEKIRFLQKEIKKQKE